MKHSTSQSPLRAHHMFLVSALLCAFAGLVAGGLEFALGYFQISLPFFIYKGAWKYFLWFGLFALAMGKVGGTGCKHHNIAINGDVVAVVMSLMTSLWSFALLYTFPSPMKELGWAVVIPSFLFFQAFLLFSYFHGKKNRPLEEEKWVGPFFMVFPQEQLERTPLSKF